MTRVNLVNVEDLADQHLFAEWREIKMVPPALDRSVNRMGGGDVLARIPDKYTLNTGHVTFFYNKMLFLYYRYKKLTEELKNRNYNIDDSRDPADIFLSIKNPAFIGDAWEPTKDEIKINIERIVLRLNERPDWYRYYGKVQPPKYFEALYDLSLIHKTLAYEYA